MEEQNTADWHCHKGNYGGPSRNSPHALAVVSEKLKGRTTPADTPLRPPSIPFATHAGSNCHDA